MSHGSTPMRTAAEVRAAIERELQERLDPAGSASVQRLQCLACRGMNELDARFCTHCGAEFNAAVVIGPAPAEW